MKILTKIALLTLVLCQLICCFTGCDFLRGGDEETTAETAFELTKENLASYTIIVSSQSNENVESVASFIQNMIYQKLGVTLEIKTDEAEVTEYEILIGLTNRAESAEIMANVDDDDYGYALVGKKIVIAGKTVSAAKEALLLFKQDVLSKADSESVLLAAGSKKIIPVEVVETTETEKVEVDTNVLNGLVINALGDSYFAGYKLENPDRDAWLSLLAKNNKMKLKNYGISGSTVSNYVDKNPMCERYDSMSNNNPNIVLVEGGRNDYNKGVPIGKTNSRDTETFSGALNVIIDGLKEKYPNAMIVCISNWNFPNDKGFDLDYKDYAKAMEKVAAEQGVYFIAAYDPKVSGIDMSNKSFRQKYSVSPSDVSHLNPDGMKIAYEHFEPILAEYYQDFLSKKGTGEN